MRRSLSVTAISAIAVLMPTVASAAGPSDGPQAVAKGCPTGTDFAFSSRTPGYSDTDVQSVPTPGPATVTLNQTKTATSTWTFSGSGTFSINALVADASATFGVSYATSNASSQAFTYGKTIAAGKTGVVKMVHQSDALADKYLRMNANCTDTVLSQGTTVVPRGTTVTGSYCIVGDYSPYASFKAGACSTEF